VAQTADTSLEARILQLEDSVRALQNTAAVAGTAVAASNATAVTLTGAASTVGSVGWDTTSGPTVDLIVLGGRIRVDVAANFEVYGNKCSLYAGYQVRGPAVASTDQYGNDLLAPTPVVIAPSLPASAQLQDDGVGMNQLGAFASFDLVTGLRPGWYRVTEAYFLAYSGTSGAPYGIASNRRLSVTRY
jgi:hypothetical protein